MASAAEILAAACRDMAKPNKCVCVCVRRFQVDASSFSFTCLTRHRMSKWRWATISSLQDQVIPKQLQTRANMHCLLHGCSFFKNNSKVADSYAHSECETPQIAPVPATPAIG